ncbi:hypothetical protein [Arachidicoccus sp.]|uniref:hypothetical protein n=1 Tax=Arachidicoccus sp. TaxID=1872624 RepID=UPI003D1C580F
MKRLKWLLLLFLTTIMSCKKSNPQTNKEESYFPNNIGNKYVYSVTDTAANSTYNLTVAIVGQASIGSKHVTIWTYTFPTNIDTNYVYANVDSVVFYDKTKTSIVNVYHLPIIVGAEWRNKFNADTSKVVSNLNLTINAGTFDNAYLIQDNAHAPNYFLDRSQWYIPNVGLVKLKIREINLGAITSQSWELIQYQLQ